MGDENERSWGGEVGILISRMLVEFFHCPLSKYENLQMIQIFEILSMYSHSWKFQWSSTKDKGTTHFKIGIVCQRHFRTSWNIMTPFKVAPFQLYDEEHDVAVQCLIQLGAGILFFYVYGWLLIQKRINFVATEPCFYSNFGILWIRGASVTWMPCQHPRDYWTKCLQNYW